MPVFRFIVGRAGLFFAAALAYPSVAAASDGFPIVSSYLSSEIGIDAKSWAVVQDSNGVLRFGSSGLASFDGQRWEVTPMNGAYALRGLDIGPDGRIWGGAAGEIGWFDRTPNGLRYHSLVEALPTEHRELGQVFHAFAEKNGAVFVTEEKIFRWDGQGFRVWTLPGTRQLRASRSDGTIFVQHRPTGLLALRESGPELFIPSSVLSSELFWLERRGADFLLLTNQGLFNWSGGPLQPLSPETNSVIRQAKITSVADLRDGRLALGTVSRGILLIARDGTLLRTLSESDGLPTRMVYSVFTDQEGQLWSTSGSHIFHVRLNSMSGIFDHRAGLTGRTILQIQMENGRLIAISDEGLHVLEAGGRSFSPHPVLNNYARDIRTTSRGTFVAMSGHVRRLENDVATSIYTNGRDVFMLEPSRREKDHLLLSESRDVKLLAPDGTTRTLASNLPDIVTSIAEDDDGRLWFGTTNRGVLTAAPDGKVSRDAVRSASSPVSIAGPATAVATVDGDILIFTTSGGWFKPRGATLFSPIAGFPHRETVATSPTRDRASVWLVLAKAEGRPAMIGQVEIEGERAVWHPHAVDAMEAIGSPRSIFAERLADNSTVLWIGGTTGIVRNVVPHGPSAPRPKAPILQVLARKSEATALSEITAPLPYSTDSIEFRLTAPQIAHRSTLRLESQIEGIDPDWVPVGPSSRRELTAVRDGRYTIRARTVADTGAASEAAVFAFEVRPPWWRTAPAIFFGLLALAPLAYGSYRLRVRSLQRDNDALEQKVRQRTEELEAASAAKTQFVANMSHDIRNPLNGIVGLALALEDTRLEPRQREIVATLRECTTYLSSLVDDVLDFASIEAGRVVLRPRAFAPLELLRSVVETLRAEAANHGATVAIDAAADLPGNLMGDAGRIQQVLVNFVSNALKYAGGNVRLTASLPHHAPGEIEFAVHDTGPGIAPEDRSKLFAKFSRLHRPEGDDTAGTGLGLAACRLLADLMGGAVGIESEVGRGSRFFLRLPLAATSAPADLPKLNLPNTTVLLVEDTDYNAWAATAVLAKLGLTCERARTGAEALRLFGEKRFNIVLLDRNLPDMDGTEVARQMREQESDGLPAILLAVTAYCTAEDRQLCLQAGMDAFVGKPLTPEKLRKVLVGAGRRLLTAASVQVPHEISPQEINTGMLEYLSDGSVEGMDEQIQRFIGEMRAAERQMAESSYARDFSRLGDDAHRLLSRAKMVGGEALAEAALRLETAARRGDGSACFEWLGRVQREIEVVTESMAHRRSAAQPA